MPCFSVPPLPDTPEYGDWVSAARPKMESFIHVADYYFRAAGVPIPRPATVENLRDWLNSRELPRDATQPADPAANRRVVHQVLLHLDCDGVDMFQLNDTIHLLIEDPTPARLGYAFVAKSCFFALRNRPDRDAPLGLE